MSLSFVLLSVGTVLAVLLSVLTSNCEARADPSHKKPWRHLSFFSSSLESHNKLDVRVAHRGVLAMEQLVPALNERGIFLREVTNGHTFLQIIYQGKESIVDCNMVRHKPEIENFLRKFFKLNSDENVNSADLTEVSERLQHGKNLTFTQLNHRDEVPDQYRELVDFNTLKDECKQVHRSMVHKAKNSRNDHHLNNNHVDSDLLNAAFTEEDRDDVKTRSHHRRSKRSMFIYPGTNWCGKGSTATNYYDLGENIDTDKCCRAHDFCSVTIEGLSSNYNYFNYRLHTLSHCECDDQFHTCLKTSGDDVSEMVGNLFFNVISNKCFILKAEKICAKRSWWGKCIRYKKQQQAELRDPLKY